VQEGDRPKFLPASSVARLSPRQQSTRVLPAYKVKSCCIVAQRMSSGQQPPSHLRSVASAPGKLILFGEHAVVHDRPAVAVATSLRTTADLEQIQELHIVLSFPDLCPATFTVPLLALHPCFSLSVPSPAPCSPEFSQLLQSIFAEHASQEHVGNAAFAAAVVPALFLLVSLVVVPGGSGCGLRLHVRSDLPVGAGLGSSAAFSVSVAAAALELSCMAAAASTAGPSACSRVERALVNDWALQATHKRRCRISSS